MPDPNAHADVTPTPAKPETMPPFWWLNPWTFAVQQWNARAKFYGYWQTADKNWYAAGNELNRLRNNRLVSEQAILDTANEAGFTESKTGYLTSGLPSTSFPLEWLGKAVAYWKGEAYAARRERDVARKDLADTAEAVAREKGEADRLYKTAGEQIALRQAAEDALAEARDVNTRLKARAKKPAKKKGGSK